MDLTEIVNWLLCLQALIFRMLKEFLELLGSPSSSNRTFSPHNQLQKHNESRNLKFYCSTMAGRKPLLQYNLKDNHDF